MPRYQPTLHPTAERELNELNPTDRNRLTDALTDVAETREPTSHPKTKSLEGQPGLFRVRVGDVRAVCTLSKPELRILRVGYRSDVYEIIDEIDDRRATA